MKKAIALLALVVLPTWAIMPAHMNKVDTAKNEAMNEIRQKLDGIKEYRTDPTKWAFVIAAEDYDETDDVAYSVESGKTFVELAQKVLGVSERRTYALIGEEATTGKIKNNLNKLLKFVQAGDTIYFYYSGHGIPDIETKEPYILPKDLDPSFVTDEPQLKLANIYKTLQESNAAKVVAFIDSCFSGATDNKTLFKGVAAPRLVAKTIKIDDTKMVVMTAGKDKQFSNMYADKNMRLFSYYMMKSIIEGKDNVRDIYKDTRSNVETKSFEFGDQYFQSPTIDGNVDMRF